MRMAFNIIGSLVLVSIIAIGGAIIALPHFLSTDLVKSKVAELVFEKTGRKLAIAGKTSFTLFPDIAVELDDITLSNPPGMSGAPLVKVGSLQTSLKLLPLFKGQTEVDSITLVNPRFDFQVDKKGNRNWDFKSAGSGAGSASSNSGKLSYGSGFTLGSITIKNGFVRYMDARTNFNELVEAINIDLVQKSSSRPITTKGNLRWHNEIVHITSKVSAPDKLMAGNSSKILMVLKSRFTDTRYEGLLSLGDQPSIDGLLVSDTRSVRKLAAFLGHDLPSGNGFGMLKLKTKITADADGAEFATSQFLFDNMDLVASGSIDLKQDRPYITAQIETDRVDLNLYTSEKGQGDTSSFGSAGSSGGAADTPIDLSALNAIDGRFNLKTDLILYEKARLGNSHFRITMKDGRANVTIEELSLYRGSATGKLVLDGGGSTAFIGGNLALNNVLTGAILRDFAGIEKLAGKGTILGDFTMRGNSAKAFKKSLKGTLKMTLLKGRIEGFDLAKYVSDLTGNNISGRQGLGGGKPTTAYDEMSGLFKINKGVARNTNFLLKGKFFRVRAAGTIDLVNEALRLRIAPKLFSGDWKFAPPLRVTGSFSNPKVTFDALAFLGGGAGVVRSLGGLLRGEKLDVGQILQKRGLQTDQEIESYLSGKKIDTRNDEPANDNVPVEGGSNADKANSPLEDLLGGKNKKANDLLKNLFR